MHGYHKLTSAKKKTRIVKHSKLTKMKTFGFDRERNVCSEKLIINRQKCSLANTSFVKFPVFEGSFRHLPYCFHIFKDILLGTYVSIFRASIAVTVG